MKNNNNTIFRLMTGFLLTAMLYASLPAYAYTPPPAPQEGIFAVSRAEAEQAVARAMEKEGVAEFIAADITNTRVSILYRYSKALGLEIKTLKFDEEKNRFSANLYLIHGDEVISVLPVSGRYEEMLPLPVARHRITHGESIALEDLDEILYPASRLRKETALSARQIVGKSPVRILSPGRPIRLSEVQAPAVLQKGAKVQMRYQTPFMAISTLGEAMEDGAKGDSIRVRNYESGAVVEAQVASGSEVYVGKRPYLVE